MFRSVPVQLNVLQYSPDDPYVQSSLPLLQLSQALFTRSFDNGATSRDLFNLSIQQPYSGSDTVIVSNGSASLITHSG